MKLTHAHTHTHTHTDLARMSPVHSYTLTHTAQMFLQNSDRYWFKAKNKVHLFPKVCLLTAETFDPGPEA